MARPGFYNDNANRDYPFVHVQTSVLPDSLVVDFGCVMGVLSGYIEDEHAVTLTRVRATETTVELEFSTSAPALLDKVLRFVVPRTAEKYTTIFADAINTSYLSTIDCELSCTEVEGCLEDVTAPCHGVSDWSGFIVLGDISAVEIFDSEMQYCDGDEGPVVNTLLYLFEGDVRVEPSLIKNLYGSFIRSINIANAERTRATSPDECKEYCWPFVLHEHYVRGECLVGSFRFVEGYNTCIEQDDADNTITINGCVGGGAGEPCLEVPISNDEGPPTTRSTFDGALRCSEVVRSINGIGDRYFEMLGGNGVTIIPVPDQNKIIVDINLQSLALCGNIRSQSSYSPEESSEDSCECGSSE